MRVLLSIKPEFAEKILNKQKKYEYRRVIHSDKSVRSVVIYMTNPIQKIVGEFEISEILSDSPDNVWSKTCQFAGISREYYDQYFAGRTRAHAFSIGTVKRYLLPIDPKLAMPSFTPPQSFMYLPDEISDNTTRHERQFEMVY